MSGISYTFGYILGTFLECVVYGIFLSLFIAACYVQWEKSSKGRGLNRLMVLATAFFGLTVTAHLAISLHQTVGAVLHNPPGAAITLSQGPPTTAWTASFMIFHLQSTVTDMIVVYRMYHIYDRDPWVCVIPSISITALFIVGCGLIKQVRDPIFDEKALKAWSTASFCLTMFDCTFFTAAISYKLWRVHRETTRAGVRIADSVILRAIRVLIESAALWTTFATINFLASLTKSNITHTFVAMSSPVLGICFCLIIARLGRIFPEAQEETWNVSIPIPSSRTRGSDGVAVLFPDVAKAFPMETINSRKQEYANSSDGSPKAIQSSLFPHSQVSVCTHSPGEE